LRSAAHEQQAETDWSLDLGELSPRRLFQTEASLVAAMKTARSSLGVERLAASAVKIAIGCT
jgi:hypothetical protein